MKKLFSLFLLTIFMLSFGCKEKGGPLNPLVCVSNAEKVSAAMMKYSESPTPANCEAYKKEVLKMLKSCPAYYSAVEKKDLEEFANTQCD